MLYLTSTQVLDRIRWMLLGALIIVLGCKSKLEAPSEKLVSVRTQVAEFVSRAQTKSLIGEFNATVQSAISFRVGGRIEQRIAEVGDHVTVGDVLAQLDSLKQAADVMAAKAALRSSEAVLEEASASEARFSALLKQIASSQQEYDDAKSAKMVAQGNVDISRTALELAETEMAYTTLRATVSGLVIARHAEVGKVVAPSEAIFTIAADGERQAVFDAFSNDISDMPITNEIHLSLASDPEVKTVGIIREISPAIDSENGTIRVKVSIPEPPSQMTLGAAVIGVGQFQPNDVIALPWTALSRREDQAAVWVVDPQSNTVSERSIVIGNYVSGLLLVTSGLESGEIIITEGTQMIRPGQRVKPIAAGPTRKNDL